VYHVTLIPARAATSSRRSPGVRRRPVSGRPTSFGRRRARLDLRNSPNILRRSISNIRYRLSIRHCGFVRLLRQPFPPRVAAPPASVWPRSAGRKSCVDAVPQTDACCRQYPS
jgi:hypothetical protein